MDLILQSKKKKKEKKFLLRRFIDGKFYLCSTVKGRTKSNYLFDQSMLELDLPSIWNNKI